MFEIHEVVQITGGTLLRGMSEKNIHHVHFDSREITGGSLFVALTGGARDGHLFLGDAAEKGAAAALISDTELAANMNTGNMALILVKDTLKAFQTLASEYRNRLNIPVIAITGSNGKTTTKDMVAHVLGQKMNVYKTYKNLNNHLGVPLSLLQIKAEHEAAVLEMGMNHYGEIDLLASLARPTVGVITNVNDAHIEFFGSRENIARAKGELLSHVDRRGYVLLNGDDPVVVNLHQLYSGKVHYFSVNPSDSVRDQTLPIADIQAGNVTYYEGGTRFEVRMEGDSFVLEMPLFGLHNVSNVLPAIWIGINNGLSRDEIRHALSTLKISGMRFEVSQGPLGSVLINDAYNASPASMKEAVKTFMNIYPDRDKVLVLGDMFELGSQSDDLHREVGAFIEKLAGQHGNRPEILVTIGEQSEHIHRAYVGNKQHFHSKEDAISFLKKYLQPQYALLFKASRGMKLEQMVHALLEDS